MNTSSLKLFLLSIAAIIGVAREIRPKRSRFMQGMTTNEPRRR